MRFSLTLITLAVSVACAQDEVFLRRSRQSRGPIVEAWVRGLNRTNFSLGACC